MKTLQLLVLFVFSLAFAGCSSDRLADTADPVTASLPQALSQGPGVSAAGAVVDNINIKTPIDVVVFNDCTGEDVHITGVEHFRGHLTINGSTFVLSQTTNDQGISGVGLTSGLKYNRTGATRENDVLHGALGTVITFTNSFDFHSQGSAPNSKIHEVFKLTVNANGELTVVFDKLTITCK